MSYRLFIHSPVGRRLGRFWFGAVFWRPYAFLLDIYQGVEMLVRRVDVCLTVLGTFKQLPKVVV